MGALLLVLIVGAVLYSAVMALAVLWPVLAVVALVWVAVKLVNRQAAIRQCRRDELAAIAKRADKQHRKIMAGDDVGGTYGDYLPPKGLR